MNVHMGKSQNSSLQRCGGATVQATRAQQQRGLLVRLTEVKIQRLQQVVELAAQNGRRGLMARMVEAEIQRLQQVVELAARNRQWGLRARLAEAEINRYWRAEIAAKSRTENNGTYRPTRQGGLDNSNLKKSIHSRKQLPISAFAKHFFSVHPSFLWTLCDRLGSTEAQKWIINLSSNGKLAPGAYTALVQLETFPDGAEKARLLEIILKQLPEFPALWKQLAFSRKDDQARLEAIARGSESRQRVLFLAREAQMCHIRKERKQ